MNIGTQFSKIKPHKVPVDFILTELPEYHYTEVIPEKYRTGNSVIDKAVAATILNSKNYISDWELAQVARWVKRINPHKLFEVMKICRKISADKNS